MHPVLTEAMSMDEIMRTWPSTVGVILRHHMLCVGCPIASFHTLSDACREHGIDRRVLAGDMEREIVNPWASAPRRA